MEGPIKCYKDYPGLGNRSVFYPCSSVGNSITFDVVQVTGRTSLLTSNVSFTETLPRAHLKKHTHLPGSPGNETNRVGQRTDVCIRFRRRKDPAVQRGGECYKDYPGLGNRSVCYPYSSVGNTFTQTRYSVWSLPAVRRPWDCSWEGKRTTIHEASSSGGVY